MLFHDWRRLWDFVMNFRKAPFTFLFLSFCSSALTEVHLASFLILRCDLAKKPQWGSNFSAFKYWDGRYDYPSIWLPKNHLWFFFFFHNGLGENQKNHFILKFITSGLKLKSSQTWAHHDAFGSKTGGLSSSPQWKSCWNLNQVSAWLGRGCHGNSIHLLGVSSRDTFNA